MPKWKAKGNQTHICSYTGETQIKNLLPIFTLSFSSILLKNMISQNLQCLLYIQRFPFPLHAYLAPQQLNCIKWGVEGKRKTTFTEVMMPQYTLLLLWQMGFVSFKHNHHFSSFWLRLCICKIITTNAAFNDPH